MRIVPAILIFFFIALQARSQYDPLSFWERDYIVKNKIKSIVSTRTQTYSESVITYTVGIEEFDRNGNCIHLRDNRRRYDHYFIYDSLNYLIAEKVGQDGRWENYTNIYENHNLVQWIFPLRKDTILYYYDSDNKLIRKIFRVRGCGYVKIFGGVDLTFPEYSNSAQFLYHYSDNIIEVKKVVKKNNRDTLILDCFFKYRGGKLKSKEENIGTDYQRAYKYKNGKLREVLEYKNKDKFGYQYTLAWRKNLVYRMDCIYGTTKKKQYYFNTYTYALW